MKLNTQKIEILSAEQGVTRAQLAQKSGLARQNLSTIIHRGTAEPKTVGKLAVGLGVSVVDIIEGGERRV